MRSRLVLVGSGLPTAAVAFDGQIGPWAFRVGLLTPAAMMLVVIAIGLAGFPTVLGAGLIGLGTTSSDLGVAWKTRGVRGAIRDHPTEIGVIVD